MSIWTIIGIVFVLIVIIIIFRNKKRGSISSSTGSSFWQKVKDACCFRRK